MKHVILLAVTAFSLAGGAASAATYTIEDFGASKPSDPYKSQGYVYDPANGVNGQCFDNATWCIKEAGTQDFLTTIDTDPDLDPNDEQTFSMLGFFMNLDGNGATEGTGEDAIENFLQITSNIGTDLLTLGLNIDYSGSSQVSIFAEDNTDDEASFLDKRSGGFWVIIESGFNDVSLLNFEALGSANVRIDCMALTQHSDSDFGGIGDIKTCIPSTPPIDPIPLPAAGWLLLAGLGGLAAMKRRKA